LDFATQANMPFCPDKSKSWSKEHMLAKRNGSSKFEEELWSLRRKQQNTQRNIISEEEFKEFEGVATETNNSFSFV